MAIDGQFVDSDKPMIQASVAWGDSVQSPYFILDTGFTGDLVVTPQLANELGLVVDAVSNARIAGGNIVPTRTATAIGVMEGQQLLLTVYIMEGWQLLGIGFMEKFSYKAEIDCKNKKVRLEPAS